MIRIGIGYDIHQLVEDRPLILGGIRITYSKGLMGYSDADVLVHAIIDALLGAAALGCLGQLFPDRDPKYKDANSMDLLAQTMALIRESGFKVVNVDTNLIAQEPRLDVYVERMCASLAEPLGVRPADVSVKPRTNEHFGPEGRGQAISAQAAVLIESVEESRQD